MSQGGGAEGGDHLSPLLEALRADAERAQYYLDLLKPVRAYDREHQGDLVETLAVYLQHGGNATRAAEALFLHRNSLRYRLARISALTGLDLDDPSHRMALQVGLMVAGSG